MCWVDADGHVHLTNPLVDLRQHPDVFQEESPPMCRDGGPGSVSSDCPYGSQPTRCPFDRYVEHYSVVQHALEDRP